MLSSTTLIGGSLGFAMQMYINALRKLPVLRSKSPYDSSVSTSSCIRLGTSFDHQSEPAI